MTALELLRRNRSESAWYEVGEGPSGALGSGCGGWMTALELLRRTLRGSGLYEVGVGPTGAFASEPERPVGERPQRGDGELARTRSGSGE